jgi:hypothetical protein
MKIEENYGVFSTEKEILNSVTKNAKPAPVKKHCGKTRKYNEGRGVLNEL